MLLHIRDRPEAVHLGSKIQSGLSNGCGMRRRRMTVTVRVPAKIDPSRPTYREPLRTAR